MLSLDVGVAMQKEEGEGGQLSAAMDKANAVASEEQDEYSETRYATVVSYWLQCCFLALDSGSNWLMQHDMKL